MAAMIQTAQATLTSDTLYNLVNYNESLQIGDKTFSGFSFTESGLTSFNAANIIVTATEVGGNYYLTWGGNISLVSGGGPTTADLLLGYTVTATSGKIFAIDQSYTGSAQPTLGTYISVAETAVVPGGDGTIVASSYLNQTITSTSFTTIGAILNPSQPILNVTKDIGFGTTDGGFVTISQIVQSFDQVVPVPEPTTIIAGALLLLPLGASTLRILRRNRMA
jgi:hypothetical protein